MRDAALRRLAVATLVGTLAIPLAAQQQPQQPAQPATPVGPPVGEMAPDFEFTGITRYGVLRDRQKLSELRGNTVVLAFFPKARTRG